MALETRIPEVAAVLHSDALVGQLKALQVAYETSDYKAYAEALQRSERRYHELFDNVPTGVYRATPDGKVTLANPAFCRMFGEKTAERLRIHRRDASVFQGLLTTLGEVRGFDGIWDRGDGGHISVRESARAVRDANGTTVFIEGIVEDVTSKKRAEMFDAGCRNVLEMVARNEPVDDILSSISDLLEAQAPDRVCCISLYCDGYLHPVPTCGFGETYGHGPIPIRAGNGACAHAAHSRRTVVVTDAAASEEFVHVRSLAMKLGIGAAWSTPICSDGRLQGTIAVFTKEPVHPDAQEVALAESVSRLAAVAIEHRSLYENLRKQATKDRLTGLPNRAVFEETLAAKLREKDPVALLWVDLDRFKEVNDSLGHGVGDALIRQVAARLTACAPEAELLARIGGDEFAVILHASTRAEAEACACNIASALQAVFEVDAYELFVTASVGISLYPEHASTAVELQQKADAAMYRAKSRGKNGYSFYEAQLERGALERLEMETSLRRALENGELRLVYQPQVDLDGRLQGMEALLRWHHPKRGIVGPTEFIPIAEETGLIVPIGSWVIREACRQCAVWREAGLGSLKVAVNVSTLQFYFSDLVEIVRAALEASNLAPSCLELELTESLIMRSSEESTRELQRLRALGVTVAIDDFGTGYSSLSYLQKLPVDMLKIDRSFLNDLEAVSTSAVIEAITSVAHSLGLRVAAEGVETASQLDSIRRIGVDLAQGYLFGKPMTADAASGYLRDRSLACA